MPPIGHFLGRGHILAQIQRFSLRHDKAASQGHFFGASAACLKRKPAENPRPKD